MVVKAYCRVNDTRQAKSTPYNSPSQTSSSSGPSRARRDTTPPRGCAVPAASRQGSVPPRGCAASASTSARLSSSGSAQGSCCNGGCADPATLEQAAAKCGNPFLPGPHTASWGNGVSDLTLPDRPHYAHAHLFSPARAVPCLPKRRYPATLCSRSVVVLAPRQRGLPTDLLRQIRRRPHHTPSQLQLLAGQRSTRG